MGIDLKNVGRIKKHGRKNLVSKNPYLRLLVKLYQFLARRTDINFNKIIAKRLIMPKRFRPPLSLSKLHSHMKNHKDSVAVVVGSITDDKRLFSCEKLKVCALRFTETARKRILDAGGECLTFDQLALKYPTGKNCVLLRGSTKARTAEKHFGNAPGRPKSKARPYVRSKGRKFEKARGRRKSRAYKK
ncbi:60S ribosomal protein L18-2, putative [Plasmodium chabaudi chabaudi]|uniref:60S ribosomal protein L18-2, putative n=2 Tax=Plasmodium chabaudi TaxID=5825 RepID=A0A077TPV4_PLACU|nr:60S ribosomal protein L18-2, putative [Plasmodium chabaudi chabaudi]SCM06070.1 60S ribosomal protein L18-2, putative [Plasmodium chabaudi chabaudi]SCM11128.1 60S ribosomal protein L18-2, putative [Plasmodium chabaudi adami]SCM13105.1 60S ribosomal protein L18-2, putative [Plasmodium chabaudi adami]VTZ70543.1 60S ribosomal protein L18-2, putative [Plasmodium chabaudi chabaudi]|eukprot:XP_016654725.1 60S ribosomal protein L18-2, putative [Plasmodium chabaudi chabaudi]